MRCIASRARCNNYANEIVYIDEATDSEDGQKVQPGATIDEKEAFRALAVEHLERLYSIARRLVGADAEDAVQEALMKSYLAFRDLKDPNAGGAWMVSILVNCCRDRGRKSSR